jgi:hypothetical protein
MGRALQRFGRGRSERNFRGGCAHVVPSVRVLGLGHVMASVWVLGLGHVVPSVRVIRLGHLMPGVRIRFGLWLGFQFRLGLGVTFVLTV